MDNKDKKIGKYSPVSFIEGNRVFRRIAEDVKLLLNKYGYSELQHRHEKQQAINFIYNCVFFGANDDGLKILKDKFSDNNIIKPEAINKFLLDNPNKAIFAEKKTVYNPTIPYYGGHARRLGHYFRNIYQAVKYVDEQNFLTPKQKYEYLAILRAQMSIYEQEVFFYNSLSDLGAIWEWEKLSRNHYPTDKDSKTKLFNQLWVTKYDFFRNILNKNGELGSGVNIKEFYPLITLEREKEFKQVGAIPFHKEGIYNTKKICRLCFNKKYIQYYSTKDEFDKVIDEIRETFPEGLPKDWECSEDICATKELLCGNKYRNLT